MHQVIRLIVYSKNKKEVREKAEEILNENLVGDEKPFDYGTFFDEGDDGMGVSGSSRFGNIPAVVLADSKEGKKLIDEGMKATKDSFMEMIKKVRKHIEFYSDEELFEEEVKDTKKKIILSLEDKKDDALKWLHQFKYYCSCLGEYEGTSIWLYGNDGEGIRNNKDLKNVLNKWNNKDYKDLKVWVIPIDVHS